jgi:hypothetical protein
MKKNIPLINSKYDIQELIREDVISLCYQGVDHNSRYPLLIWEYKAEYLNAQLVTRLIHLSGKLIQIQHPNMLNMLDYVYDGQSFYAIYKSPGKFVTLDTFFKQVKEVKVDQLWSFSSQLLSVLLTFEQLGLNCGAVNFSDILVTSNKSLVLSRASMSLEVYKANRKNLAVIEDCVFYAPEFILNGSYSNASDMYSFGVLLFIFFSQKWPYKYTILIDQMREEIVKGPIDFEPSYSRVPDQLARLITVCMKPDKEHRFSSFVELIKVYRGDLGFVDIASKSRSRIKERLSDYMDLKKSILVVTWVKRTLLALLVVLIFFIVNRVHFSYMTSIPEVAVPNVIGMELKKAETLLSQYQLRSLVSGEKFHSEIKKGGIIETNPPVGRVVKEKRLIRLFLSKGSGPILLPDLVGYTKQNAKKLLDDHGISVEIVNEAYSLQYPQGSVLSQSPNANTHVGPSENVKLVLSKGVPITVTVKKAVPSFNQDKSHLRRVMVDLFILKEWPNQALSIYVDNKRERRKLYSGHIESGKELNLEFELELDANIDIFFGDQSVFVSPIKDQVEI